MTDTTITPSPPTRRWLSPKDRPSIILSNGRRLEPRVKVAEELGMSERSVRRMNPPTTYLANVAYIDRDETLKLIGAGLKRRDKNPRRRRRAHP